MAQSLTTHWSAIHAAAAGDDGYREEFALRYAAPVRAYLTARWQNADLRQHVDDAVQEVFVECLRPDGPLSRVDPERNGGFRAYFYGIIRNIAREFERRIGGEQRRIAHGDVALDQVISNDESLPDVYERSWAKSVMQWARQRQMERARESGSDAVRRVDLLTLKFSEGRTIRSIAEQWKTDEKRLYKEFAKAQDEFQAALIEVVRLHCPGSPEEILFECGRLAELLRQ